MRRICTNLSDTLIHNHQLYLIGKTHHAIVFTWPTKMFKTCQCMSFSRLAYLHTCICIYQQCKCSNYSPWAYIAISTTIHSLWPSLARLLQTSLYQSPSTSLAIPYTNFVSPNITLATTSIYKDNFGQITLQAFLSKQGPKIVLTKPDGNCLFRSLATLVTGDQEDY